ncbi:unnamed protein product [Notodromas monacha]|uniref:Uncharacterized protein n=1 Tax=Notodromas monacha TaxID=399045 RepID=A0A7R9BV99_9CRUS|nr:unnamed protein product [Notodromas monacha]CAG0920877.1 unnamed protein product [Notodromas monacha]
MLLVRHGLMLVGESLGGKSSAYQCLAAALSMAAEKYPNMVCEAKVTYRIINPKALDLGHLYGCFEKVSHEWSDGILANAFREMATTTTSDQYWLILDGPVDAFWIENMNTVLDDNRKLCLMSGEIIQAIYTRDPIIIVKVDFENNIVLRKHDMTDWLIQPCLSFIEKECQTFVRTSDIHLVQSFTRMFECLVMETHENQLETFHGVAALNWMQCLFLFSVVWSMGAILIGESRLKFDEFFRQLILGFNLAHPKPKSFKLQRNQLFPETGTVFDFVFERKDAGHWVGWIDTVNKKSLQIPPNAKVSELLIPTDETARQQYFLKLLLSRKKPLIFVGPTGTGKSAIISHHLMGLPKDKYLPNILSFSARTTAPQAQDVIMNKLDRRRKGVFGPPMGKTCVLFIDDLNMPQKEEFGSQPPIELLRQWIDHGYWYERKETTRLEIIDTLLVAAMCPAATGGKNDVTFRFLRHLNVIGMEAFDDANLTKIFGSILDWHFTKGFELGVVRMAKAVTGATLEIYKAAMRHFRPTPAKSHYLFNLRDFSRVIRGILLVPSTHLNDSGKLIRLWAHEVTRSFYDRLNDANDRVQFVELLKDSCQNNFKQTLDRAVLGAAQATSSGRSTVVDENHVKKIMFGDYFYPDADTRVYDEIANTDKLTSVMESYLNEYNMVSKTPMSIVMFQFATDHVSRLCRVLKQDSGHALLIGMGGSGRQSCCKLAAFIAGYELCQLEMSRNYGLEQWRDDLKKILMKAGGEGKPTVFLFTDSQIKDESFVEDINLLLNTGDIPNLYQADERAEILERMQAAAREQGRKIDPSPLSLYNFFVERVKRNLHIFIVMSPIGEAFRVRLRMFPSLINCCTIDWFTPWPEEALERVANKFLSEVDLDDEIRTKCVQMCNKFHQSVVVMSEEFRKALGRPNYVTPTSFLELILTFKNLLNVKRNQLLVLRSRYVTGLQRLEYATSQISVMQERETALRPQLMQLSAETEKLMIKIEKDTVNVESQKEVVAADEAASNEAAAAAQAIKDDCENELAEALPALNAAVSALNTLKPADITLVKAMKNPPGGVKLVMEAVCVMLDRKPEKKADPAVLGKYIDDWWTTSQKVLGDLRFLDTLRSYDKDNILPHIMAKIREKYILNPDFDPEVIKDVSRACVNLCKWVRAMEVYDRVNKIVAPKKERLQGAERELEAQMANIKRKKELEDELSLCSQKLDRAEKLIDGLGGEKERWSQCAEELGNRYTNITGDVMVSAAIIAYLGPFTADFRRDCVTKWAQDCVDAGIPCSVPFSLSATMGDSVKIRAWHMNGLPVDSFSIDNAIIVTNARRWPLMIDPQGQANKWIRNAEKDNGIAVLKLSDPGYLRTLETAVQFGRPVLLENVGEELDPALEPLLSRQTIKSGGVDYIKLGEQLIEFNPEFRLYMTTRMRNPHFVPEISVKVTVLNFMLTSVGLEDQLLGIVAARERPQLETRKNQLIVEGAENKRKLKELEDRILEVLAAEGNILDDETGIQVLSSSKLLSEEIKKKELVIAATENEIDSTRNQYKPVATHSSRLFFCISELANIDPMYQYSLAWFVRLYEQAIVGSTKSEDIQERVTFLNDHFTYSVYKNVCRSLFEKDKLLFAFLLCISVQREKGALHEDLLQFLFAGSVALENPYSNPGCGWLNERAWSDIVQASAHKELHGLRESFDRHTEGWKRVYDALEPNTVPFPGVFSTANAMQKLVILKCLRPDKLIPAVQDFIVENMGATYVEPPAFDLAGSFVDSSHRSPIIFVLSPGADPMAALVKFADIKGMTDKLKSISLGQGQASCSLGFDRKNRRDVEILRHLNGPIAAELIEEGVVEGGWVVLQNCHLAASWMPDLERLCEDVVNTDKTNAEFRLWLTSYPSIHFPVSILQNGVKMTNEAPKGLKANLLRSYANPPICDAEFYSSCKKDAAWQRLLFGLCFFHALAQERRHFGPLGWNVSYEFNDSDLRISVAQLKLFLDEYDDVPFSALLYLTGECNYGGRVTDDKDRRLLMSLLSLVYCPKIIQTDRYNLTGGGDYYCPPVKTYDEFVSHIRALPMTSSPEAFGLHDNANITKENQETSEARMTLLKGLLLTQPQRLTPASTEKNGVKSPGEMVLELAEDILARLPEPFDLAGVESKYPIQYEDSMNTVLRQEVAKYNRLLKEVKSSLEQVCSAVQGLIIMSVELENLHNSLLLGKIPGSWKSKAYPSRKPLGSFIGDFLLRLRFFQSWIDHGSPKVFWISAFFFAPSFLTGTLQNFARKYNAPIDRLVFRFSITDKKMDPTHSCSVDPDLHGLFLEGARWDWQEKVLAESEPKVLYDPLPIIGLHPYERKLDETEDVFVVLPSYYEILTGQIA